MHALLPVAAFVVTLLGFAALNFPIPEVVPWLSIMLWALAVTQLAAFLPSLHRPPEIPHEFRDDPEFRDQQDTYEAPVGPSWFVSNPSFRFPEVHEGTPQWIRVLKGVYIGALVVFLGLLGYILVVFALVRGES